MTNLQIERREQQRQLLVQRASIEQAKKVQACYEAWAAREDLMKHEAMNKDVAAALNLS